jgi:transposase-like protein
LKVTPEVDQHIRRHLKPTNDSWRVDETNIKVRGVWKYLYRAVDSEGKTLDLMLSSKRDGRAAARFFRKVLKRQHTQSPRLSRYAGGEALAVDKHVADPGARETLKAAAVIDPETELRQSKSLNHVIEPDHRNIKRSVKPMRGFKSFNRARRTLSGIKAMKLIRKGPVSM